MHEIKLDPEKYSEEFRAGVAYAAHILAVCAAGDVPPGIRPCCLGEVRAFALGMGEGFEDSAAMKSDCPCTAPPAAAAEVSESALCGKTDDSNCCGCRKPVGHGGGCRFVRLDRF